MIWANAGILAVQHSCGTEGTQGHGSANVSKVTDSASLGIAVGHEAFPGLIARLVYPRGR